MREILSSASFDRNNDLVREAPDLASQRFEDAPRSGAQAERAMRRLDEMTRDENDNVFMDLKPGDMQFIISRPPFSWTPISDGFGRWMIDQQLEQAVGSIANLVEQGLSQIEDVVLQRKSALAFRREARVVEPLLSRLSSGKASLPSGRSLESAVGSRPCDRPDKV